MPGLSSVGPQTVSCRPLPGGGLRAGAHLETRFATVRGIGPERKESQMKRLTRAAFWVPLLSALPVVSLLVLGTAPAQATFGMMRRATVAARGSRGRVCAMCAAVVVLVLAGAMGARAQARAYPYRLVDPGTFGGPGSFVVLPGLPITSNGTVLGTADTTTPDPDLPVTDCGGFCDGYVQHAFAWRSGRLADLGALA